MPNRCQSPPPSGYDLIFKDFALPRAMHSLAPCKIKKPMNKLTIQPNIQQLNAITEVSN